MFKRFSCYDLDVRQARQSCETLIPLCFRCNASIRTSALVIHLAFRSRSEKTYLSKFEQIEFFGPLISNLNA